MHLKSYIEFCDLHSFPYDPTVETLSNFIVYTAHYISPLSISAYLSSICNGMEDLFPDVRKACKHSLVLRILKGCIRRFSLSQCKRPLTLNHLLTFSRAYPLPSHDDLLFLALVSCGFFGLHRLRELVDEDDPLQRSCFSRIRRFTVVSSDNHIRYVMPAHKTWKGLFSEESSISISRIPNCPFDPFSIFLRYLRSRDTLALFHPYLLHSFLPVGRHSLRLGGATFFASQGWSAASPFPAAPV
ncbi:hypothetical protein BGW80DRAFT_1435791 [Lactifluus volemus]|nr:hypothetical protein BGW80DRAFT_1435791 [Lactifluus volemus]